MSLYNGNFVLVAIGLSDAEEELEINPSVELISVSSMKWLSCELRPIYVCTDAF